MDQIFALRQMVEKRWEYALPIYCAFMDLEKAYDSVWRHGMWQLAKYYGMVLLAMIVSGRANIEIENECSDL